MIDVFLLICLSLPVTMLALAIIYDARRRSRNKASASLKPGRHDQTL